LTPKSSVPARFLSSEILNILSKQCPLIVSTCEVDAMDTTKPLAVMQALRIASRYATMTLTIGSIALYCSLQAPRAAFRYAITTLTPKSSVPAPFLSPAILNILSKQCPLAVTTCEVDAMDTTNPPLVLLQEDAAPVATPVSSPIAHEEEEEATDEPGSDRLYFLTMPLVLLQEDATPVAAPTKPLTVLQALRSASLDAITTLTIGSIAFYCIVFVLWQILFGCVGDAPLKLLIQVFGTMVIALIAKYVTEAIWHYFWLVLIHDTDDVLEYPDAVLEDPDDVLEDPDDVLEDAGGEVAGQDNVPVEAPLATVTIAAPLRRSKRVAALLCCALCPEVAPNAFATRGGLRRSARLAAKPRVNYKPYLTCQ
jgi:hypothetical protein